VKRKKGKRKTLPKIGRKRGPIQEEGKYLKEVLNSIIPVEKGKGRAHHFFQDHKKIGERGTYARITSSIRGGKTPRKKKRKWN